MPVRQMRNTEMPIKMYKKSQTGANNQFGGVNDGLCRRVYQEDMEVRVNIEPINPELTQTARLMSSFNAS